MKVERLSGPSKCKVRDVPVGDVFEYEGEYYLRVDHGLFDVWSVHVDGSGGLPDGYKVTPVRAKLVIE